MSRTLGLDFTLSESMSFVGSPCLDRGQPRPPGVYVVDTRCRIGGANDEASAAAVCDAYIKDILARPFPLTPGGLYIELAPGSFNIQSSAFAAYAPGTFPGSDGNYLGSLPMQPHLAFEPSRISVKKLMVVAGGGIARFTGASVCVWDTTHKAPNFSTPAAAAVDCVPSGDGWAVGDRYAIFAPPPLNYRGLNPGWPYQALSQNTLGSVLGVYGGQRGEITIIRRVRAPGWPVADGYSIYPSSPPPPCCPP